MYCLKGLLIHLSIGCTMKCTPLEWWSHWNCRNSSHFDAVFSLVRFVAIDNQQTALRLMWTSQCWYSSAVIQPFVEALICTWFAAANVATLSKRSTGLVFQQTVLLTPLTHMLTIDTEMFSNSVVAGFILALPFYDGDLEPDCVGVSKWLRMIKSAVVILSTTSAIIPNLVVSFKLILSPRE